MMTSKTPDQQPNHKGQLTAIHDQGSTVNHQHPILLFDGVCNFCNASVQWVLLRDKAGIFRFTALQSDIGQAILQHHGLDHKNLDSVVLVDQQKIFLRSDVPLELMRRLGGLWRLFLVFKIIPRSWRDAAYNWIAKNRYRWWGRQEACMLPRSEWKQRFL